MSGKFRFAIDRGGTFTDIYAECPNGEVRVMKLLSVDPSNYPDAPREGIRRILEKETGQKMPQDQPIDGSQIEWIRMGTTVATNALLERKGDRMALVITKGFKDLLYIGNQARPKIFDLKITTPGVLYEEVVEVDARVVPCMEGQCQLPDEFWRGSEIGTTGEMLHVWKTIDKEKVRQDLEKVKQKGINSIAVVLMHSYMYANDELEVGEIAKSLGIAQVSLSHEVMPMLRIVSRGFTACADAYLTPCIQKYVQGFASGFKDNLKGVNVLFMQSDGGLTPMESFCGSRAILSGPAGGVVGYAVTTSTTQPIIGFDMGGTSTDVSRFAGSYDHVFETTTAGITIQAPQLDVNTVAAGGGSMLFFRSGMFVVGPESGGAHPGPACYRKGGPLTVTDANLILNRLLPEYFPKIFGPQENESLDKEVALMKFEQLTKEINEFLAYQNPSDNIKMTVEEVALGFIRVANETMCRPIRALTQAKGYDTRDHVLACFGGAGAQHACAISRSLGIGKVFIHKYAGILSAYGMACADVVKELQEPCATTYKHENFNYLNERIEVLSAICTKQLKLQGFQEENIQIEPFLHMRYPGTDCALMCSPKQTRGGFVHATTTGDYESSFLERYKNEFGFTLPDREILVDNIRIRGTGKASLSSSKSHSASSVGDSLPIEKEVDVCFDTIGFAKSKVYLLEKLPPGSVVDGPAIIMDKLSTILVEPECSATITEAGDIEILVSSSVKQDIGIQLDTIQLSIFSHRFMSIAEQMGRILQRTSISTNIKERLDFSCALFGPDGGLVSNAPHIPVHLGAMQETVQYQIKTLGDEIQQGDVLLSNHPKAGGSHLPDLTVITPVFYRNGPRPVFFVASRGHHADIGGITPGSMPPHSKTLSEEGATFKNFFLVKRGVFQETELIEALMAPSKIPNSSGTRNLSDNLSDLKAQIAANQRGILLVQELIDIYSLRVVQAYMAHIQNNSKIAVRNMLREIGKTTLQNTGKSTLQAVDYLDDGSPIRLRIDIDIDDGSAVCDFSGTGYEVWGNCNAPKAITLSALIYCLRCMVGHDVPLNQGCLKPITVIIPPGSLLDPSDDAAVVGGNVLTSQRITDVVFKAFGTVAASQGCMNNVTFGQSSWGYYETIAGGAGAGPSWNGRSGVHTHMTNTRITDPEVLEKRYPVILKQFSLRKNSGGDGNFKGGDGVIRELLFRADIDLSLLTERRVFQPYGLKGGLPGKKGKNLMVKADGRIISLSSKTAILCQPGDTLLLKTPGGGGYGLPKDTAGNDSTDFQGSGEPPTFIERGSVFDYSQRQESV
ncbi:5-oxoprolinase isoform X2 [Bemisia tabaci]